MDTERDRAQATSTGRGVRILIENGEYWLSNKGDLAMLEVAVARLRNRWPEARIGVLTYVPALLRAYLPEVEAIKPDDARAWSGPSLTERLATRLGPNVIGPFTYSRLLAKAGRARDKLMSVLRRAVRQGANPSPPDALPAGIVRAMTDATLVIALGGGYLTDVDPGQAYRLLNVVTAADQAGKPVALLGQGIGPMSDPAMKQRAAQALPTVNLIALRERRRGPTLLSQLGVPGANVEVTGDDAIELPYSVRSDRMGTEIGVCLRIAYYSPLSAAVRDMVGDALQQTATRLQAPLAPMFIAEFDAEDRRSTLPLVSGYSTVTRPLGRFAAPRAIAAQVSRCRVVVTGAYHLGVFALAQGIPIVALTASEYYDDKFNGLADMFGGGVHLVHLNDDGLGERLSAAIDAMWTTAPQCREPLRRAARQQIASSSAAFDRACHLLHEPTSALSCPRRAAHHGSRRSAADA